MRSRSLWVALFKRPKREAVGQVGSRRDIFDAVQDPPRGVDPAIREEARVLVDYQWTNAQSDNKLRIARG